MAVQIPKKTIPIRGFSLRLADVEKIVKKLDELQKRHGKERVGNFEKPAGMNTDKWERDKSEYFEKSFQVSIIFYSPSGASVFVEGAEKFSTPSRPEVLSGIFITNTIAHSAFTGRNPDCSFSLSFDFKKAPLLDGQNPVSAPTQNQSVLEIQGDNDAWIAAVESAVMEVLGSRRNTRGFLHAAFTYDYGLIIFGIPASFYILYTLQSLFQEKMASMDSIFRAALYLYIFFCGIWIYRILFGYTKWAFPIIELLDQEERTRAHRAFWAALILSILGSAGWDLLN